MFGSRGTWGSRDPLESGCGVPYVPVVDTRTDSDPNRPDTDREEIESIPWDSLLAEDTGDRRRWLMVAGAALAVVAISASAARTLWPASPDPVATPPASTVTTPTTAPPPTEPPSPPLSEADLAAVEPAAVQREAAAHGLLAVHGYLTSDGSGSWAPAELFPEAEAPEIRSFVEAAVVTSVVPVSDRRFAVTVLARTLAAPPGEGYVRQPLRALEVVVELTGDDARLVDLPRPVEPPPAAAAELSLTEAEPPRPVVEAALAEAGRLGEPDPEQLVAATTADGVWRVTVPVVDEVGGVWPVAVWVDGSGVLLPAGG